MVVGVVRVFVGVVVVLLSLLITEWSGDRVANIDSGTPVTKPIDLLSTH